MPTDKSVNSPTFTSQYGTSLWLLVNIYRQSSDTAVYKMPTYEELAGNAGVSFEFKPLRQDDDFIRLIRVHDDLIYLEEASFSVACTMPPQVIRTCVYHMSRAFRHHHVLLV